MFFHVFHLHTVQFPVLSLSGHKMIAVSSIQALRAVWEECAASQLAHTFPMDIVMTKKLRWLDAGAWKKNLDEKTIDIEILLVDSE